MKGLFYEVIGRGNHQNVLFYDKDDYIQFINRLALACYETKTLLVAFELLSNHYHLIVRSKDISAFKHYLGMSLARKFNNKYRTTGMFASRKTVSIELLDPKIDGGEDFKDAVSYTLRNIVRHGIQSRYQDYIWSSYRLYFNKRENNLIVQNARANINDRQLLRKYLPRPHELPKGYTIAKSGLILPQCFVMCEEVETFFKNKTEFDIFLTQPGRRELRNIASDQKREKLELENKIISKTKKRLLCSDDVLQDIINQKINEKKLLDRNAPASIIQMTLSEKLELCIYLKRNVPGCSFRQISRFMGIPESTIRFNCKS